jgi:hypothetical protein
LASTLITALDAALSMSIVWNNVQLIGNEESAEYRLGAWANRSAVGCPACLPPGNPQRVRRLMLNTAGGIPVVSDKGKQDMQKNQWGWGGFTTQDMHRSQITARAVALVYNWWSWYVRAANPQARREALTSRPLLLAAVGRTVSHGGQTMLYLTPMHAEAGLIKSMIANVHAAIQHVKHAAEQLPKLDRWRALLAYICQRIVGTRRRCQPRRRRSRRRGNCRI